MMGMDNTYEGLDLDNAIFIGFMMGLRDVLGRGSQSIANIIGIHVSNEILRFAEAHNMNINSFDDFKYFADKYGLAGYLELEEFTDHIVIKIAKCKICPKKIGKYEFDGTACPWGGILNGILSNIKNEQYSIAANLTPGEVCEITLKKR